METYRSTLTWTLRALAALALVALISQLGSMIFFRAMGAAPVVVATILLTQAWAALMAWGLSELLAERSGIPRTPLRAASPWIMRFTALGLLVCLAPIASGIISESGGAPFYEVLFSLTGLLLQPALLLVLAEALSQMNRSTLTGTAQ